MKVSARTAACVTKAETGEIIDAGTECWPQAEALVGFLNAFELSGDDKFFCRRGASLELH